MKIVLTIMLLFSFTSIAQQISITFDDAPKGDGAYFSGMERTKILIDKLSKLGVEQAAFFCTTKNKDSLAMSRLQKYADAGHLIANHSHSHYSLNRTSAVKYWKDLLDADSILSGYNNFRKWYRFPMLHEGNSIERRDSIRSLLTQYGYMNGYVTIDNYDWHIDRILKIAIESGDSIDYDKFGNFYVDHIWTSIKFYDDIAKRSIDRSPKHVLLLHENDVAALFIDKLVNKIRNEGWKIITADDAYNDPISEYTPSTLFNNQGRVAAIAADKGFSKRNLVQYSEDVNYLDSLAAKRELFIK